MHTIPCPWCGDRPEGEFTYGGDASGSMPDLEAGEGAWFDFVYLRDNPAGPHPEHWHHGSGCGRWFRLWRDTATHEVLPEEGGP
jgi:sarcosine oxidase subunit delta